MASFPDIPEGYGIPLVNLDTDLLPAPTMAALFTTLESEIDTAVAGIEVTVTGSTIVYHGSNAATVRPSTNGNAVIWVGSVYPLNAIVGDLVPDVEVPPEPPAVIFADNYNRANGDPGVTPTGGLALNVVGTATPAIINNELGLTADTGTSYLTYLASSADGVFRIKLGNRQAAAGFGIVFRFSNGSNHLMLCRVSSGVQNWRLIKRVASTTAQDIYVSSSPITAGDTFVITLSGTSITITLNGVAWWSGTVTDHASLMRYGTMWTAVDIAGATSFDDISLTELS